MTDFESAFDYVHQTLQNMEDSGARIRASRRSVQKLLAQGKLAATATPPPQPKPTQPGNTVVAEKVQTPAPSVGTAAPVIREASPSAPLARIAPVSGTNTERLAAMRGPVLACTRCPHLVKSRTQVVFGVGNPDAELMFVGEAPGEDEDKQGEPFVGRAGQLLTKIIETMGFGRSDVYIGNVLKCRPDMPPGVSGNRKPRLDEMQTCLPYLREQIDIIKPRALVALGATALEGLTGENIPVGRVRGKWRDFQSIPLMVTYHPAYLLRNQAIGEKRKVWEDMLLVLEKLGKPISEKQRQYFSRA